MRRRELVISPAVSVGESDNVLLVVVEDGHAALAHVVDADGQTEEFGLGPNVGTERDPLSVVLRVESRHCRNVSPGLVLLFHYFPSILQ